MGKVFTTIFFHHEESKKNTAQTETNAHALASAYKALSNCEVHIKKKKFYKCNFISLEVHIKKKEILFQLLNVILFH